MKGSRRESKLKVYTTSEVLCAGCAHTDIPGAAQDAGWVERGVGGIVTIHRNNRVSVRGAVAVGSLFSSPAADHGRHSQHSHRPDDGGDDDDNEEQKKWKADWMTG